MDRTVNLTAYWDTLHEQRWLYWLPVIGYAGFIFYLSSLANPTKELPSFLGEANDKLIHVVEYGVLGVLAYRALRWAAGRWCAAQAWWLAIVVATLYGVSDEIHQAFVPPRSAEVFDVAADAFGAMILTFTWRRFTDPTGRAR